MPVCAISSWLRAEAEVFFNGVRRLFDLILNRGWNVLRRYLLQGQIESFEVRENISGDGLLTLLKAWNRGDLFAAYGGVFCPADGLFPWCRFDDAPFG